jgi:hypothetical protein
MGLQSEMAVTGGYTFGTSVQPTASNRFGLSGAPSGVISFADGTGAGQANQVFQANLSIATVTMQLYDLKGGNGELDVLNVLLAMTAVKFVYLEITTPAAATSLRFGPQAQTNAAQLWFQAATANFYDTINSKFLMEDARAGWALDATHKVLGIYNPGATTVTGKLWVFGTK